MPVALPAARHQARLGSVPLHHTPDLCFLGELLRPAFKSPTAIKTTPHRETCSKSTNSSAAAVRQGGQAQRGLSCTSNLSCRRARYAANHHPHAGVALLCCFCLVSSDRFDNLAHVPRGTTAEKGNSLRVFRLHRATATMTLLAVEVSGSFD